MAWATNGFGRQGTRYEGPSVKKTPPKEETPPEPTVPEEPKDIADDIPPTGDEDTEL